MENIQNCHSTNPNDLCELNHLGERIYCGYCYSTLFDFKYELLDEAENVIAAFETAKELHEVLSDVEAFGLSAGAYYGRKVSDDS